jgi:hypothetical protein
LHRPIETTRQTEAAWLSGKKERTTHVESKTLLTGIGLLMEGPNHHFRLAES